MKQHRHLIFFAAATIAVVAGLVLFINKHRGTT